MEPPSTTGELAVDVLRKHAAAFAEHSPHAGEGDDPEQVHQTRVATRRMRAGIRLFADVLPPQAASLNDELQWIASQLGPLRDLDVQLDRLGDNATTLGISHVLVPYNAWLDDQRQRALTALLDAFRSQRFQDLGHRLEDLGGWTPDAEHDQPLLDDGPQRLRRAYQRLRKSADQLDADSAAAELHKTRIRAKRLRYAVEFFEAIYGKPARRLITRAVDLQDLLGDHQDGIVCVRRLDEGVQAAAETWPAQTLLALGQVVQWEAQRSRQIRGRFAATYRAVKDEWSRLRRAL